MLDMSEIEAVAATARRNARLGKILGRVSLYVTVVAVALLTFFPIYWMLVSVFQPNKYTLHYPPPLFPKEISFSEFALLFNGYPVATWLWNSFQIAVTAMLVCTALTILGAYTLSCLRWTGRSAFGLFLLVTQMLPEILIVIPLYVMYNRLGLLDNLFTLALVDASFALPICIWILKGVFDTVPSEVMDAAVVDGCTELSVLWHVVLPLSAPGLVAVAVVSFFTAWNEYLFALILITTTDFQPASVGIPNLKATGTTPVEQYMAAGLIFSILPVLFYLLMQRYIISGLTAGAVKG
jgi:multiple sugar transport system permease protein